MGESFKTEAVSCCIIIVRYVFKKQVFLWQCQNKWVFSLTFFTWKWWVIGVSASLL